MPDANGKPLRSDAGTPNPLLTNTSYDILKDSITLGLPGVGVLYSSIAGLWGLPFQEEIVGTISAVGLFAGIVLKIASRRYEKLETINDGELVVNLVDPMKETLSLQVNEDMNTLPTKDTLRIKVVNES